METAAERASKPPDRPSIHSDRPKRQDAAQTLPWISTASAAATIAIEIALSVTALRHAGSRRRRDAGRDRAGRSSR